jgi:hypothetical protein
VPGFRFHDFGHCAITSLAESGAGDSTIRRLHWGTVHGALRSGLRAARQILNQSFSSATL